MLLRSQKIPSTQNLKIWNLKKLKGPPRIGSIPRVPDNYAYSNFQPTMSVCMCINNPTINISILLSESSQLRTTYSYDWVRTDWFVLLHGWAFRFLYVVHRLIERHTLWPQAKLVHRNNKKCERLFIFKQTNELKKIWIRKNYAIIQKIEKISAGSKTIGRKNFSSLIGKKNIGCHIFFRA